MSGAFPGPGRPGRFSRGDERHQRNLPENKEGNRAESIREEYAKLGIEVDLDEEDTMKIRGGRIRGGHVHSHDDHRIAMSLAVAALNADTPVVIENPACVAKSFPDFFERLESLRTAE